MKLERALELVGMCRNGEDVLTVLTPCEKKYIDDLWVTMPPYIGLRHAIEVVAVLIEGEKRGQLIENLEIRGGGQELP